MTTVTAVTTSTADVAWAAGTDGVSGVSGYDVYANGALAASTSATGTALTGLVPNTVYSITVVTIDVAGNRSPESLPAIAATDPSDTTPLTTVLSVNPPAPDGSNGWYVTTPTVTLSAEPSTAPAAIYYSWESTVGPYSIYTGPTAPPEGSSILYFSAHDGAGLPVRADEPTRQAPFLVDTLTPATPSVTASVTSYSSVRLTWPAVLGTPSGISRYDVYRNGAFLVCGDRPVHRRRRARPGHDVQLRRIRRQCRRNRLGEFGERGGDDSDGAASLRSVRRIRRILVGELLLRQLERSQYRHGRRRELSDLALRERRRVLGDRHRDRRGL